jgi:hypothetical protein
MSEPLKNNLIGFLLAPTEEFKLLKLGDVIGLALAEGIDLEQEKNDYLDLVELRALGKQYLKGSPKWFAQASRKQADIQMRVLGKILKERPSILKEASEKVAEIDFAKILRGEKEAEKNA